MTKYKLLLSIILLSLLGSSSFSQQQAWNWYFGQNAALNFSTGSPVAIAGSAISTYEGSASISDGAGNLLFYTDGSTVWNINNTAMPNGFGLLGNSSSTQSAVIVEMPGSDSLYYIFTADQGGYAGANVGVKYSLVNMSLNAGLGDITLKNIPVDSPSCEKITAVRHCNGMDAWIIIHGFESDTFKAYLLTNAGLSNTPVISTVGIVYANISSFYDETIGYLKASPNGRKLASAVYDDIDTVEVFDFDNSTGLITNPITLPYSTGAGIYGVSFSPDNLKLYVSEWGGNDDLYQYDLTSNNQTTILASQYLVSSGVSYGDVQIGPDGKLYVCVIGASALSVINFPNVLGTGCNYVAAAVSLGGGTCDGGLPNFVDAYYTPPPPASVTIDTTSCSSPMVLTATSSGSGYLWNTGDTTYSISVNASGTYWVQVQGANGCNILINIIDTFNVTLATPFMVNIGPDSSICNGDSVILNAGNPGNNYLWSTGATTQSITVLNTGNYWVQVNNGGCSVTDSALITVVNNPTVNLGPDSVICIGSNIILNAGNSGFNYLWSTGATTQTININTAGNYWVYVNVGACSGTDTIHITTVNPPVVNLGTDSSVCTGQTVTLNAGNAGGSYSWSTGATTQSITATNSGTYWVLVNNGACIGADSMILNVIATPVVNIGPDSIICKGSTLVLDAGNSGYTYHWSDGSSNQAITVDSTGRYWVIVNNGKCAQGDSVNVTVDNPATPNPGPDTVICGNNYTLSAGTTASHYLWSTGDTTRNISVFAPGGHYWIVSGDGRCFKTDSINISFKNDSDYWAPPNIFTPNGDGKNEAFIPGIISTQNYHMSIYNRWGELMFETTNPYLYWNGKNKGGSDCFDGTYYWIAQYSLGCNPNEIKKDKGYLTLIRN